MKRTALLFCITLAMALQATAQTNTIDKNKVMLFFQDQDYEEAISYLSPLAVADSTNTQVLGYLAFAYSMNDNDILAKKYYRQLYAVDSNNLAAIQYLSNSRDLDDSTLVITLVRTLIAKQPNKA